METDGLYILFGLIAMLVVVVFVGTGAPKLHVNKSTGKKGKGGNEMTFAAPDGKTYKIVLPDDKKPEPKKRKGVQVKYRQ